MVAASARAQVGEGRYADKSADAPFVDPAPGVEVDELEKSVLTKLPAQSPVAETGVHEFCRCVAGDAQAVAKIEKVLRGPLHSTGIEFTDTPLEEVANLLQEEYDIPVQLDKPALEEIGLGADEPITVKLQNISLLAALRLMLKTKQLTYIIQDEVLLITTPEEAEQDLVTCVYDVRGLISGTHGKAFDELIDTIVSCVATDTWAENGGGEAEIRPLKTGLLVISQTRAVHDEIRGLVAAIRQVKQERPEGQNAAAADEGDDQVVTRSYMLRLKPTDDVNNMREQVQELIVKSLPEANWDHRLNNGQAVSLTVLHDRVVVRHKPSIQDKVEELLSDSGIAVLGHSAGPWGGGGGGGVDGPETNPPKRDGHPREQASNAAGGGLGGGGRQAKRGDGGGVFRPADATRD
jgi:hypothetical protein